MEEHLNGRLWIDWKPAREQERSTGWLAPLRSEGALSDLNGSPLPPAFAFGAALENCL
jgi:hypothetical protein